MDSAWDEPADVRTAQPFGLATVKDGFAQAWLAGARAVSRRQVTRLGGPRGGMGGAVRPRPDAR
jgi:hypothetical protein